MFEIIKNYYENYDEDGRLFRDNAHKVENLASKLNTASDEDFKKYMEYHYATCEDESIIGTSIHGLWIGRKQSK